jgi:putative ABC transport system ATP-binding protein
MVAVIRLEEVKKTYFISELVQVPAIKGISFKVDRGEFISIVGKSGSGKSTAMNMVGCLDYPTGGSVFLEGKKTTSLSEDALAALRGRKIGFIFQKFNLIQSLSALENVMLPMIFQGVSREKRISRATEILRLVGLDHRLTHKPSELSGGESQRVAIARSLANDPDLILADEPTGNLDSKTGRQIMDLLKKLNKEEGKTIVMITHDDSLAREAERIIKLKDGFILDEN